MSPHPSDNNDEPNYAGLSVGSTFTGQPNADLVAISDDGVTWCVVDLLGGSGSVNVNLDAAAAAAGMTFTNDFQVLFQQYDDYDWTYDGRAFDNVQLSVAVYLKK